MTADISATGTGLPIAGGAMLANAGSKAGWLWGPWMLGGSAVMTSAGTGSKPDLAMCEGSAGTTACVAPSLAAEAFISAVCEVVSSISSASVRARVDVRSISLPTLSPMLTRATAALMAAISSGVMSWGMPAGSGRSKGTAAGAGAAGAGAAGADTSASARSRRVAGGAGTSGSGSEAPGETLGIFRRAFHPDSSSPYWGALSETRRSKLAMVVI